MDHAAQPDRRRLSGSDQLDRGQRSVERHKRIFAERWPASKVSFSDPIELSALILCIVTISSAQPYLF
jgi:hypothetical protein